VAPEACPGADGAAGLAGMWAGGVSPAAGATWVGWDLRDAAAAGAALVIHPPAVVRCELALAGLVGAVLLVKLYPARDLHQLVLGCHEGCVLERW